MPSIEDLVNLPEDGKRYEILDGDLVVTARSAIIQRHGIVGAPDLLVEILLPSTAERDRDTKAKLYARFDVDHYWIVDAESEVLEVYVRDGASYRAPVIHRGRAVVHAAPFSEYALDLGTVWE